ncbi:MAG: ATP-dependent RecD-like DNA helicase [Clostridia bacterium]|nr:ATP-dependent RecD-like DNA helicase [Clostridia bacterium]
MSLQNYDGQLLEITGIIDRVIFKNQENGYTVLDIDCNGSLITAVGELPFINEGENIKAVGSFKEHPNFGKQFVIKAYEKTMPDNAQAISKYLSSGVIKGIGKITAQRIVNRFKEDTLKIIENAPLELTKIKGISKEKAQMISDEFKNITGIREIMMYFFEFSVTVQECIRIWKKFGNSAITEVKNNPYAICDDEIKISFEKAEQIALSLSKPLDDLLRLQYGVLYVLKHNMLNGHTCIPNDKLIPLCAKYLQVSDDLINNAVKELLKEEKIVEFNLKNREYIALEDIHQSEKFCAQRLKLMLSYPPNSISDCEKKIEQIEQKNKIKYAEKQKQAIKNAMQKGLLIMTGGPGTGKTTTIKAIISVLEQNSEDVVLAAPTGRAAKRMTELTGAPAKTIHRLLCAEFCEKDGYKFTKNEKNPLRCDAVILDELSMVDLKMFDALLKALPLNCRLIMIGDSDQLPSVGAGNVLKDMIDSNALPVVVLNEVFRQSLKSLIVTNAHKIVCGEYPQLMSVDKDFFFLDKFSTEEIMETVAELYISRLKKAYNYNPLEDIQILTPGRKGNLGSIEINKYIQKHLNPASAKKNEINKNGFVLREGDKVMQIKNNYDINFTRTDGTLGSGIFNGDIGIIENINRKTKEVIVSFDDKIVLYQKDDADDLELAYAITIHKAQGSEFKAVIMPMFFGAKQLCYRNLLYTAVTRAKNILVMLGIKKIVNDMVDNNRRAKRYTALCDFLREENEDNR